MSNTTDWKKRAEQAEAKVKRMQQLLRNLRHLIPHADKEEGCRGCKLVARLDAEL